MLKSLLFTESQIPLAFVYNQLSHCSYRVVCRNFIHTIRFSRAVLYTSLFRGPNGVIIDGRKHE